jgi:hypothetical protein
MTTEAYLRVEPQERISPDNLQGYLRSCPGVRMIKASEGCFAFREAGVGMSHPLTQATVRLDLPHGVRLEWHNETLGTSLIGFVIMFLLNELPHCQILVEKHKTAHFPQGA